MKLIRCYIENFGNLHQYEINFSSGLTILREENGFGKSTLAVFIRSMFYGLPRSTKSLEKNDRKRYFPWNGGKYGGTLDFEYHQKCYRIERTFGAIPKQDEFKLYTLDPFAISTDFSEKIGEELFGVKAESFDKTTYMPQTHWNKEFANSELIALLSNLAENTSDMGQYESALHKLKTQRNQLLAYRGNSGLIHELSDKINDLEIKLDSAIRAKEEILELQKSLAEDEHQIDILQDQLNLITYDIASIDHQKIQSIIFTQSKVLENEILSLKLELDQLMLNYPYGFPNNKEVANINDQLYQLEHLEQSEYINFDHQRMHELEEFFAEGVPSSKSMAQIEEIYQSYTEQSDISTDVEAVLKSNAHSSKNRFVLSILLFALSIPMTFLLYHISPEIPYYVIGIIMNFASVFYLIFAFLKFRTTKKHIKQMKLDLESKRAELSKIIDLYYEYIDEFNLSNLDIEDSFQTLKNNRNEYLMLCQKQKQLSSQYDRARIQVQNNLKHTLDKYHLFITPFNRKIFSQILNAKIKKERLEQEIDSRQKQIDLLQMKYSNTMHSSYADNIEGLQVKEAALHQEIKTLEKQILSKHMQIQNFTNEAQLIPEIELQLHLHKTNLNASLVEIKLLDKTIAHLNTAHEELTKRYIVPIKKRFSEITNELMNIQEDQLAISKDLTVYLKKYGSHRELAYFSIGELDMIAICMRIALVDVLYSHRTPLLILDDPFVNLDEKNLNRAIKLLQKLGQSHQILYLTCHESRT